MTDWNQKIHAHVHDPPEKAYDYSDTHRQRAEAHLANLKIPESVWKGKEPDHLAAAADRFIFPTTRRKQGEQWVPTGVEKLGEDVSFKHPLSGHPAFAKDQFPNEADAHDIISDALPAFADLQDADKFWLLWRLWLQFSVTHHHGQRAGAGLLAYLPADTRIPDGSIWHHMSVVSALESTRNAAGKLEPAFLLFQIGPVQEFIAQARSTRDLWSGSYLLSWLMAHAMQALTWDLGPDAVIFPLLRGQPLYDWLNQGKLKLAKHRSTDGAVSANAWNELGLENLQSLVLTPNLPNRFLALVPADFDPDTISEALTKEWMQIAAASWNFLNSRSSLGPDKEKLWQFQVENFLQISWQKWPWQEVSTALDSLDRIPMGTKSVLRDGAAVASAIPSAHQDTRCYHLSPGWAWSAHYQLLSHHHDGRRQTRDFAAWASNPQVPKDNLSGKEEVIADDAWLAQARHDNTLRHLFRKGDRLGAVNLIKRVWHRAHLEAKQNLRRAVETFDSIPAVAATPYLSRLRKFTGPSGSLRELFVAADGFPSLASGVREYFTGGAIADWNKCSEDEWFHRTDASVLHIHEWDSAIADCPSEEGKVALHKARSALERLQRRLGGQPSKYYCVLALDGDQIGKWLSGEKTPTMGDVITPAAVGYFKRELAGKVKVEEWLASPRPLSPSYHLQFSEALANFGLYCARRIVEAHHGQLIYAGGDDVLAMLPADEALACAQGLRLAFQGKSKALVAHDQGRYSHLFDGDVPDGFIQLKDGDWNQGARRPAEPSWPLLVLGPKATVSIGLAIGHIKEPLQDMVQEAQRAEKRAKASPEKEVWNRQKNEMEWKPAEGGNRDALAVTLYKRSGEMVQWGAKFGSTAFDLLDFFRAHYRTPLDRPEVEMPIAGKFPYRITEMLAKFGGSQQVTLEVFNVAEAEVDWVIGQQTRKGYRIETDDALRELRDQLRHRCRSYLAELREYEWEDSDTRVPRKCPRQLREFYDLFALEAFIARQGE